MDQWIALLSGVLFSTIGVFISVASGFGRRQRLKLAVEVQQSIAPDQHADWQAMIARDAASIMKTSLRPVPLWLLYLTGMALGLTIYLPFVPERLRLALSATGVLLLVGMLVLAIIYRVLDRVRKGHSAKRLEKLNGMVDQLTQERDSARAETKTLRDRRDELERLFAERKQSLTKLVIGTVYFSGAPMSEVRHLETVGDLNSDSYNVDEHRQQPMWRIRARWRVRHPAPRYGTLLKLAKTVRAVNEQTEAIDALHEASGAADASETSTGARD